MDAIPVAEGVSTLHYTSRNYYMALGGAVHREAWNGSATI